MSLSTYVIGGECSKISEVSRAGTATRAACARNENRITSVAAIVAPHVCDLVRGASVLITPVRPV